jgi:hypothetical protein
MEVGRKRVSEIQEEKRGGGVCGSKRKKKRRAAFKRREVRMRARGALSPRGRQGNGHKSRMTLVLYQKTRR